MLWHNEMSEWLSLGKSLLYFLQQNNVDDFIFKHVLLPQSRENMTQNILGRICGGRGMGIPPTEKVRRGLALGLLALSRSLEVLSKDQKPALESRSVELAEVSAGEVAALF